MSTPSRMIADEACRAVRQKIWDAHWVAGGRTLTHTQVIDYIREIRVSANCTEAQLPPGLVYLLSDARDKPPSADMQLSKLICALNQVILPMI